MFYSHEVLTSRKYGVATVWLVATLGSKSTLKKVNRKAILDVDVPKACETIIQPEAPMALRLQSNLLYGVSRVYSQQCGYVLVDAQTAQNNMRALLRVIKTAELDPEAGRARPDQITLQDDPAFLPDLNLGMLDFDLSNLDFSTSASSQRPSLLTLQTSQTSAQGSGHADPSIGGLVIPTSVSSGGPVGDIGGFIVGDDGRGISRQDAGGIFAQGEDDGFLPEADFGFDVEGNLLEYDAGARTPRAPIAPMLPTGLGSDTVASARVRQEHEEGQRAEAGVNDDFVMPPNDDYGHFPAGEAFPTVMGQVRRSGIARSSSAALADGDASDTAGAPLRRKRKAPRVIQVDQTMELRNGDLARWNTEYLRNMTEASKLKWHHKAPAIAKRNAEFWVSGRGIGNVGSGLGRSGLKTPLYMFCGPRLLELLTGVSQSAAGQKHGREDEDDHQTDDSGRRVRPRVEDGDQVGRGDVGMLDDDMPMLDDGIELGRDAPSALDDMSSAMPWNISASRRGSSIPRTGVLGLSASAGGLSSIGGPPGSLSRRGSRLVSASPLLGRGRPSDLEELPNDVAQDQAHLDNFELHGPGAQVDTQTAHQSQWTRQALDNESLNLLDFIETGIEEKSKLIERGAVGEQVEPSNTVSFEELLPRASNSRIVAAQALLHTLALAAKNLIRVEQQEAFGRITIQMVQTV
ncbi:Rec8 like protein-domain-containing protein [Cryomyces antarcticus]